MVEVFVQSFPAIRESLAKTFNTATVQFAVNGNFTAIPVKVIELERFLAAGVTLPAIDIPKAIRPFAERWWQELREELEPLAGKSIDPRFIATIHLGGTP